ncbi:hypothetical protein ACFSDD_18970 [Salipiger marinus]|uniref:hypothetical protein n=1 Tax=Salipiger marinus TaxID=555512 RepID=UPI002BE07FD6|nr:hypothetical protein [Salipiger manganoxidans]MEB3418710.1 hypothetical protein [Salipiger manganoxidans]
MREALLQLAGIWSSACATASRRPPSGSPTSCASIAACSIVAAVRARNIDQAVRAVQEHRDSARDDLLARM